MFTAMSMPHLSHQPRFEHRAKSLTSSCEVHEARLSVFDCVYHFHPEVELIAIHNSHGICLINEQLERFQAGDVLLIGSNAPHSFTNRQQDSNGPDWTRYTVVQLLPNIVGQGNTFLPELAPVRELLQSETSFMLEAKLRDAVRNRMSTLYKESSGRGVLGILEVLEMIATNLDQARPLAPAMPDNSLLRHDAERLARVHRYINDHSTDQLKLEAVAGCASMAPSSFSRFFRKKTGKTFQEHLTEVRVLNACSRLVLSNDSVTNICYESGFNNLSNFNRQFRRLKGCTPSQFREQWYREAKEHSAHAFSTNPVLNFQNENFCSTSYGTCSVSAAR